MSIQSERVANAEKNGWVSECFAVDDPDSYGVGWVLRDENGEEIGFAGRWEELPEYKND